jgi:hypothetical protein
MRRSQTDTAEYASPTFVNANNPSINWPADTFTSSSPNLTSLRPDRPRLVAGQYKIRALPQIIAGDPYLQGWNSTIMANATIYYNSPPVVHVFDGGPSLSGILDPAREVRPKFGIMTNLLTLYSGETTCQALCICLSHDERHFLG